MSVWLGTKSNPRRGRHASDPHPRPVFGRGRRLMEALRGRNTKREKG